MSVYIFVNVGGTISRVKQFLKFLYQNCIILYSYQSNRNNEVLIDSLKNWILWNIKLSVFLDKLSCPIKIYVCVVQIVGSKTSYYYVYI